jgi:hypothetical protein
VPLREEWEKGRTEVRRLQRQSIGPITPESVMVGHDEKLSRFLKAMDALGEIAGGFFEEFVDEGLVGLGLLGGPAAKQRDVSHLRRLKIYIPRTQRLRAGLTSGAPTALEERIKPKMPG